MEKNPPPPKPASLPPSIHPTDLVWAPEQIQGAQTTGGFGRTQLCLEAMEPKKWRKTVVWARSTLGKVKSSTFWKTSGSQMGKTHGFLSWKSTKLVDFVGLGRKVVLGFEAAKTPKDSNPTNHLEGIPGFQTTWGPNSPLAETWNPQKKKVWKMMFRKSIDSDFWVPSFPFQGCTFLLREGKGGPQGGRDWKLMKF